jgi:hypothetical protein
MVAFLPASLLNKLSEVHLQVLKHYVELLILYLYSLSVDDVRMVEELEHLEFSLIQDVLHGGVRAVELLDCYYFP